MALAVLERFGPHWLEWPRWMRDIGEDTGWLRIEECQEEGTLVIRAEVPGVDPDKDVEVSLKDHTLHISAKREQQTETKEKGFFRSEFHYGELTRDLALPVGVDMKAITAEYKDGILEVRVPIPAEPELEATKVPVTHA